MAIGSLGQYLEDSSVIDVLVKDAVMIKHKDFLAHGPYIKTWIGELAPQDSSGNSYENAGQPRGGGWYVDPFFSHPTNEVGREHIPGKLLSAKKA